MLNWSILKLKNSWNRDTVCCTWILPRQVGWRICGKLPWGDRAEQAQGGKERRDKWGCSVLLTAWCRVKFPRQRLNAVPRGLHTVWGALHEQRCIRRNVKSCLSATAPSWGYHPSSCDIKHPARGALSFPWASLTPHQSQFTLLDFRSTESLMKGGRQILIKGWTEQKTENTAMSTFSLPLKATAVQSSLNTQIQPFLPMHDQEAANSPAHGACGKGAKQRYRSSMCPFYPHIPQSQQSPAVQQLSTPWAFSPFHKRTPRLCSQFPSPLHCLSLLPPKTDASSAAQESHRLNTS